MVFNATFSYIVVSFIDGGNQSIREKTTNMTPSTYKLYHIMLY
jgi:hypothetical protein